MPPDSTQQTPIISQPPSGGYKFEPPQSSPPRRTRESIKSILSTIGILIAAPLIAILLTSFVFQSYEVDGPSMETSLQNGDRLIVIKTGKTWASITNDAYIPKRGEIIVFARPEEGQRQLIKRVIGLPGERVVVKNGQITVYNGSFPEGFNPDDDIRFRNQVDASTPGNVDLKVPSDQIFVAGDNRDNSLDSRSFGTIEADDIVGSLSLRIYPFSQFKKF